MSLVYSTKVYGRSYGFIYLCDRFLHCDARVGCHPNSNKPLGTLADKELRKWRSLAHYQFDPLWQLGVFNSRNAAYKWLAKAMGLPPQQTHIAMFDKKQCQREIGIIQQQFWELQGNIPLTKKDNDIKPRALARRHRQRL